MGIIESIVGIVVASAVGALGVGATGLNIIGATIVAGIIWGGNAISKSLAPKREATQSSPTYQFNSLQTQTNNQLPIPLIYGENKIAGNRIWQELRQNSTQIDRIIALGEGEIEEVADIRLNDIPINELSGVVLRVYLGKGASNSENPPAPVDSIVGGDLLERINAVGSLKGLAYVALSVKASDKIRGDYNFTAVVKGRKVRVYEDVSTWSYQYSNNPAWCLLDFLISYNGCGIGLLEDGRIDDVKIAESIDIQSFIDSASYCDELIVPSLQDGSVVQNDGGEVERVKRFCFNMIIDSKAPRHEIIEEFKKSCRGALTLKGKKLQFKIDRPSPPCKQILAKDIIPGSEQFSTIANEENYDRIIVKYRSKEHDWAICEAIAEKVNFENVPPVEHEVNIYAVTDFNQASRLAWYYLNKVLKEKQTGYFETDSRAFDLEIGDIISLSDNLMGFVNFLVKITQLKDLQNGTFGVYWREFKSDLFTDTLGSKPATCQILGTGVSSPPTPQNFKISQNYWGINVSWELTVSQSILYSVKTGQNWPFGDLVADNVASGPLFFPITKPGLYKFFLKSKNQYGVYSKEACEASIYISSVPNTNTILDEDISKKMAKIRGLRLYNGALKPTPIGFWQKGSMLSLEEAEFLHKETWEKMGRKCWLHNHFEGDGRIFITQIFDLGSITETLMSHTSKASSGSGTWFIRTSLDNLEWGEFEPFSQKVISFRYYQMKFEPKEGFFIEREPVLSLDVQDREESYRNIEIDSENGAVIEFATHPQSKTKAGFFKEVSAVATLHDNAGYCYIASKSLDSVCIRAKTNDGESVSLVCDVHVRGF